MIAGNNPDQCGSVNWRSGPLKWRHDNDLVSLLIVGSSRVPNVRSVSIDRSAWTDSRLVQIHRLAGFRARACRSCKPQLRQALFGNAGFGDKTTRKFCRRTVRRRLVDASGSRSQFGRSGKRVLWIRIQHDERVPLRGFRVALYFDYVKAHEGGCSSHCMSAETTTMPAATRGGIAISGAWILCKLTYLVAKVRPATASWIMMVEHGRSTSGLAQMGRSNRRCRSRGRGSWT